MTLRSQRRFGKREAIEVAAGEGNDVFDVAATEMAMIGVTGALGIMAQLAFHESQEAQKGAMTKEGKRLSGKTIDALSQVRDAINDLLAGDNPKGKSGSKDEADDSDSQDDTNGVGDAVVKYIDSANKALLDKEITDMSSDELEKVLNARDERLVAILADTLDDGKSVKKSKVKIDDEVEADNAYAAKSEDLMTEEEIEAKRAAKEAKKALKAARQAEKDAAENAAVQKAIAEGVAEATEAVRTLQDRLATVEKMAAPSNVVRTRPQEALTKSAERDDLEIRLAHLERVARTTPDNDIRKASREEAAEIRTKITSLSAN